MGQSVVMQPEIKSSIGEAGSDQWRARVAAGALGAAVAVLGLGLVGCSSDDDGTPGASTTSTGGGAGGSGGSGTGAAGGTGGSGTGGTGAGGGAEPCPADMICPDSFPFHHEGDTSQSERRDLDGYSCSPNTNESGPEIVYRLILPADGFLSAVVVDSPPAVDIDLHILSALDSQACIDRGNSAVSAHITAGTYYLVADTWTSSNDTEAAGPYSVDIGYIVPSLGDCSMTSDVVQRPSGGDVQLPSNGPVVMEAHLVTVDDGLGAAWPQAIGDGIPHHYDVSSGATSFVMLRTQPWAPQEGCEFGQSAYGDKLPVLDESWYLNMMWSNRPDAGTRMIVQKPEGGPAVVTAAGYETGPGDTTNLAGVPEEVHYYLGTTHQGELRIGFAADQNLPLGPIDCGP